MSLLYRESSERLSCGEALRGDSESRRSLAESSKASGCHTLTQMTWDPCFRIRERGHQRWDEELGG